MDYFFPGVVSLLALLIFYAFHKSIERKTGKSLKNTKSDGFMLFAFFSGGLSSVLVNLFEIDSSMWIFTGSLICMGFCLVVGRLIFGTSTPNKALEKGADNKGAS